MEGSLKELLRIPSPSGDWECQNALRKALEKFYPELKEVHLVDSKVRVLNAETATAAKVRVLIESTDGKDTWTTVGVSTDIVNASWIALVDSLEYKLCKEKVGK